MHRLLVTSVVFVAFCSCAADALAAACEDLVRLNRPATTVSLAQTVAAGAFTPPATGGGRGGGAAAQLYPKLPAFCRVAATLAPSSDSDIKVEVWLPAVRMERQASRRSATAAWRGRSPIRRMAAALNAGYATAGTDTGHVGEQRRLHSGPPREAGGLRLPCHSRDGRRGQGDRPIALRRRAEALVFQRLLAGRPAGHHQRAALSRGLRRHRRRRFRVEPDAHARRAVVGEPRHEPHARERHSRRASTR